MAEKRRATTFRTSRGAIVNVAYPSIYIAPSIAPVDVTSPAEMREALREELATGRTWTFPRRGGIPWDNEQGIMYLKTYGDKLYGWQNAMGVVWEFDGKDWIVAHQEPLPLPSFRGVSYGAEIFKDKLNIGHFQFDGTTWRTVTGLPQASSINALKEFNGRLYAVVYTYPYTANLYVSDDGLTFNVLWTAPLAEADFLRCLEVYWGNLYIGGAKTAAAPIYRFTGVLPPTLVYTTTGNEVGLLDALSGRLNAYVSGTAIVNIYVYAKAPYTPVVWTNTGYAIPVGCGFESVEYKGARVIGTHRGGYCYALYGSGLNRLIVVPFHRSNYSFVGFETYKGRLYMSHEGSIALEKNAASVWEFDGPPTQPIPVQYRLWTDQAVLAVATRTAALPTVGGRKTFMLFSTVGGTLNIEVDPDGSGTYYTFTVPAETIVANVLWRYTTLDEFAWARLSFTPTAPATVQAWLNVVPE